MRTSPSFLFPLALSLLACGRSTIEGPEDLPSVVELTAGSPGSSTAGTSSIAGSGGITHGGIHSGGYGPSGQGGMSQSGMNQGGAGQGGMNQGGAGQGGMNQGGAGQGGMNQGGAGQGGMNQGGMCANGLDVPDSICTTCIDAKCCDESTKCNLDKACHSLFQCLISCNNQAICLQKCLDQFPDGLPMFQTVGECVGENCEASCGSEEGGAGGSAGVGGSAGAGGWNIYCGDGNVDPGEQCDDGGKNIDASALLISYSAKKVPIVPLRTGQDVQAFYNYFSQSSHTGYEALMMSRTLLFQDPITGDLSLVLTHGIDKKLTDIPQPNSSVGMKISGPNSMFVQFADDSPKELSMMGPGFAVGNWHFNDNSDGGILSGFPFPGDWNIEISTSFQKGITTWTFMDGNGNFFDLKLDTQLGIESHSKLQGKCRTDCTIPFCGDGRLDAGEECDDGNVQPWDGCSPSCTMESAVPF